MVEAEKKKLEELLKEVILCKKCEEVKKKNLVNKHKAGQLEESDIHTRFHVYSKGTQTRFMFIMEKPGEGGKEGKYLGQSFLDGEKLVDFSEYVKRRQKAFIKWIDKQNKLFELKSFFDTVNTVLALKEPIGKDQKFFEHVHVTDVQKCIDGTPGKCFNKFLIEEIKLLQPDLVFCFGSTAWGKIKACKDFEVKSADGYGGSMKIKDIHGRLFNFKINDKIVWVMPCLHFSFRTRNSAPRNSYMDCIKEGLERFKEINKSS
ncbi:uracil DNA glycosylase superfamily protein [archaeon BMS3Bbin16]|nr:uracil DNA glycosylase superfamily protein [archaeon BMS3Bbin16]